MSEVTARAPRCEPAASARTRENPFPVFPGEIRVRGPMKKSRMGRRRAIVLGAVHVLIVAHATHWLTKGRTLSPVEPSESMRTLELGEVNAGFVFFVLAILSTAIFGRFVCGWACHLVALQDLCGWIMKRMGIRPRPFRSRLLLFAPLVFALYMFVWPSLKRLVLAPPVRAISPDATLFQPAGPFPGFSDHLITEHFWATFPTLWVAIPFLAICGFATVYLLGAKGFCTYGCPYGGFFAPAEKFAVGRIRVTDACEQCGHCTAGCTSNVRVHEEVREYGMVVDPGCMKCMDCVSTCPNDALYFGFGTPAAKKPPARTGQRYRVYDLPLGHEIGLAATFAGAFFAVRGVYDRVPLLMAIGVAGCVAFLAWLAIRTLRESSTSLQNLTLKSEGRLSAAGGTFLAVCTLVFVLVVQSGFVQAHRARAEAWDRAVRVPAEVAFREEQPEIPAPILDAADRAAAHYERADRIGAGGWGLLETPEVVVRRAWIALVRGRPDEAAGHIRRVIAAGHADRQARFDLARVVELGGDLDEAAALWRELLAADPADAAAHRELARVLERAGDPEGAVAALIVVVNLDPGDGAARLRLAQLLEDLGRPSEAARYR
jgi:polyferredoxin